MRELISKFYTAYASDGGTMITTSDKFWAEMEITWNDAPVGDGIVINGLLLSLLHDNIQIYIAPSVEV